MRFQSLDLNMGDNYVDKHRHPHFPVDRDAFDKDREKYWRERGKAERKRRRAAAKGKC